MAMESDRNSTNNSRPNASSWRTRIDPRHGQADVPVLFRLPNLQKVDARGEPLASAAPEARPRTSPPSNGTANATAERASEIHPAATAIKHDVDQVDPTAGAAVSLDPVETASTHGKRRYSNGLILLALLAVAAFGLGRYGQVKPSSTISAPSLTVAVSPGPAPIPPTHMAIETPTPEAEELIIPTLPQLPDTDTNVDQGNVEVQDIATSQQRMTTIVNDSIDRVMPLTLANDDTEKVSILDKDNANVKSDSEPDVSLPAMLDQNSVASGPQNTASVSSSTSSVGNADKNLATSSPSPSKDTKSATATTVASSAASDPTIIPSTKTPLTDFDQLMQVRNNFLNEQARESQMTALAKARQTQNPYAPSANVASMTKPIGGGFGATPSTVSAQTTGYGGFPSNTTQISNPNTTLNNDFSSPNPTLGPSSSSPNVAVPQSGFQQPQPYIPLGPQLISGAPEAGWQVGPSSYASSSSTAPPSPQGYAQPANQPYQSPYNQSSGANATAPVQSMPQGYQPIGSALTPNGF